MMSTVNERFGRFLGRFRRQEEGLVAIEFIFYFLGFWAILVVAYEFGYMNFRHAMLEKSMDIAVRDIRLSTGHPPSYDEVKAQICERAGVLSNCSENLLLELKVVEPRNVEVFDKANCRNGVQPIAPETTFKNSAGQDNDLMLMRACLTFRPIFGAVGFGKLISQDSGGNAQLIVTSAFVQEPR